MNAVMAIAHERASADKQQGRHYQQGQKANDVLSDPSPYKICGSGREATRPHQRQSQCQGRLEANRFSNIIAKDTDVAIAVASTAFLSRQQC